MSEEIKIERQNPTDIYKQRVAAIKNKLPRKWRQLFLNKHPEYDNDFGLNLLNNVYKCQTADVLITKEMERISNDYVTEILLGRKNESE